MKYQIKALNLWSSFLCYYGSFSVCHGNSSQRLIKNREMFIIVIGVILKCDLPPISTPKGISMVIKNILALFY